MCKHPPLASALGKLLKGKANLKLFVFKERKQEGKGFANRLDLRTVAGDVSGLWPLASTRDYGMGRVTDSEFQLARG